MLERDGETIRIYQSKGKAWFTLLSTTALTAGAAAAQRAGWIDYELWIILAVGGVGILATLVRLLSKKPILVIESTGLQISGGFFGKPMSVPWNHIQSFMLRSKLGNQMIGVILKSEFSDSYGAIPRMGFEQLGFHLGIPCVMLPGEKTQMLELLTMKLEASRSR